MVRYKLIKEYPGSPKLNTIYIWDEVQKSYNNIDKFHEFTRDLHLIEKYPEFWELVVEKDYEILSMKCNKSSLLHFNNVESSINFMLKNDYSIHSVKRLSDSEIFTIGDKIQLDNDNKEFGTITELYISHEQLRFYCGRLGGVICHDVDKRNNFTKLKQKLFTTEDGVDIFEGDEYYYINSNFNNPWKIIHTKADCPGIIDKNNLTYKRFSTKEKAEKYILYNKPLLSLSDVWDNLKIKDQKEVMKFVKSKLNK